MGRTNDDKNLIEIFTEGMRGSGFPSGGPSSSGAPSPLLGMGILAIAALAILGFATADIPVQNTPESSTSSSGLSSVMGFGMILGTIALAAAALTGTNRPAMARPLPAPAP